MNDPWFKFYASDWLAGTRGLTPAETGIYITLVAMMYERREPLDMERARLARLCNCPTGAFRKALEGLIEEGKILDTDNGLWNERVGIEIQDREVASRNGRASARKRWSEPAEKTKEKQRQTNAVASISQYDPDANQKPESDREDTDVSSTKRPKRKSRMPDDATITEAMLRAAFKRGLSQQEAEAQFEKFKNDALAKGKTFVDWDRAFVTWLDSPYFHPTTPPRGPRQEKRHGNDTDIINRVAARFGEVDSGEGPDEPVALFPPRIVGGIG